MAKHNYAMPEMASSGGRDIWNLTSKPGSLVLQPDWRVLLVRQERSAHIDQDRGWKCKCRSRLPIELNLSDAKMAHHSLPSPVQSTGADKGNSLIVNIFFNLLLGSRHTHQGHQSCTYWFEPAAGCRAALVVLPHGNTDDSPE